MYKSSEDQYIREYWIRASAFWYAFCIIQKNQIIYIHLNWKIAKYEFDSFNYIPSNQKKINCTRRNESSVWTLNHCKHDGELIYCNVDNCAKSNYEESDESNKEEFQDNSNSSQTRNSTVSTQSSLKRPPKTLHSHTHNLLKW